ncbi:hypothetical protein IAG44_18795 [Streptomyces roseirectus]|uniref:Uncharacterized protein n=1 Tax=Streptomyces roseirectus TaxID=2768066 RepID=A0A7H0IER7_9ACTN|nr:hypothetical protein [Streptomyces roseirectus]QNP71283.1 hypothetical protein IAG44_18795 [Streptomyces roseirectus]
MSFDDLLAAVPIAVGGITVVGFAVVGFTVAGFTIVAVTALRRAKAASVPDVLRALASLARVMLRRRR